MGLLLECKLKHSAKPRFWTCMPGTLYFGGVPGKRMPEIKKARQFASS